jgi:hypothetical protein
MANNIQAVIVLGVAFATSSCMATPYGRTPGERAQTQLAKALAGRVPGPPQRCLASFRTRDMQVIDDNTILFHQGRTVYVQRPPNGCPGISSGSRTLVTRPLGSTELCAGDFNYTVDLRTGVRGGACVFGPFVPYTRR